jgi:spermidine/putrescine transport system permease protein
MKIGLIEEQLHLLYNEFSVLLGLVYGELPFMILPIYASLEKIELSLIEASKDLGADEFSTLKRVIFPLTLPGVIVGVVIVFIPTLGSFIVSDLLGGAKSMLVGNLIQNQFIVARDKPFGSAIAFVLSGFVLLLLYIYKKISKGKIEIL